MRVPFKKVRQVQDNVTTTMLWIAAIAATCLGVVSAGGLLFASK